jgi:DNA-binding NarL/FixJ family response regulator
MNAHRVFVIWNHPLFYESIRLFLQHTNVECIGACQNMDEAISQINNLHPDTILVEETESGDTSRRVIDLIESSSINLRIFRLNMNDNDLKIYHREQMTVMQAEDLVHLIRNNG